MRFLDEIDVLPIVSTDAADFNPFDWQNTKKKGWQVFFGVELDDADFRQHKIERDVARGACLMVPTSPHLGYNSDHIRILYNKKEYKLSDAHWLVRQILTAQVSILFREKIPFHLHTRTDGWLSPVMTTTFWHSVTRDRIKPITALTVLPDPEGSHNFAKNLIKQTADTLQEHQFEAMAEEFLGRAESIDALVDRIALIREYVTVEVPQLDEKDIVVRESRTLIDRETNMVTPVSVTFFTQNHGLDFFGEEKWMEIVGSHCQPGLLRGTHNVVDEHGVELFCEYSFTTRERAIAALQSVHLKLDS